MKRWFCGGLDRSGGSAVLFRLLFRNTVSMVIKRGDELWEEGVHMVSLCVIENREYYEWGWGILLMEVLWLKFFLCLISDALFSFKDILRERWYFFNMLKWNEVGRLIWLSDNGSVLLQMMMVCSLKLFTSIPKRKHHVAQRRSLSLQFLTSSCIGF